MLVYIVSIVCPSEDFSEGLRTIYCAFIDKEWQDGNEFSSRRKNRIGSLLGLFQRDCVVNDLDRLRGDGLHSRQKWGGTVDDMRCAERFEKIAVVKRGGGDDRAKSGELGKLNY